MGNRLTFPNGILSIATDWTSAAYGYMLLNSAATNPDPSVDIYIADIVAGEATAGAYARQVVTTPIVTVALPASVDAAGYVKFGCDPPDFGILTGGEQEAWLILFRDTGVDATSEIVAANIIFYEADSVSDCLIGLSSQGAVALSTICPDGF
jgi:hypothetical protein